jgi:hypothetical protein
MERDGWVSIRDLFVMRDLRVRGPMVLRPFVVSGFWHINGAVIPSAYPKRARHARTGSLSLSILCWALGGSIE